MLAGQPDVAEDRLRRALSRRSRRWARRTAGHDRAMLAQAIYAQGRPEEAWRFCEASRGLPQTMTCPPRSLVVARARRSSRDKDAETRRRLSLDEAVELAASTDFLTHHGQAFLDLAECCK